MRSLSDDLKAMFPMRPVSKESAEKFGEVVDGLREWAKSAPPEPEAARVARERLDALTGRGPSPWANLWSSLDDAGSLLCRLETDLAHRPPATPAERLAALDRVRALSVAIGRAWQVADGLGWRHPDAQDERGASDGG